MCNTFEKVLMVAILLGSLASCGGSKAVGGSSAANDALLGQEEAKQTVMTYVSKQGAKPDTSPVGSVEEAREVLESDTVTRFDGAEGFLRGKAGAEPMALHAEIEACHSETLKYLAFALEDQTRKKEERRIHLEGKKEQGLTVNEKDEAFLASVKEEVKKEREVVEAMRILAVSHLLRAQDLAAAFAKKHPKEPAGILTLAHVSLLKGEWKVYDRLIEKLDEETSKSFEAGYLQAMEELTRGSSSEKAAELLEKLEKNHPKKIRATAMLLMIAEDDESAGEKLEELKKKAKNHIVSMVLGDWLTRS